MMWDRSMVGMRDINTDLLTHSEATLIRFSRLLGGISNFGWSDNSMLESCFPPSFFHLSIWFSAPSS